MSGISTTAGVNQKIVTVVGQGSIPGPMARASVLGFTWDGLTYQPSDQLSQLSNQKMFTGPVDPSTVAGVVLGVYDQWIHTA